MTYARRKSSYDGENAGAMRASLAALENIEMRATTDPTGKPLRVENFEDIRAGVRKMIDTLAATRIARLRPRCAPCCPA